MRADGADAAAAVSQEPQAEVGAQLGVLLEQQLWELPPGAKTDTGQPLPVLDQKGPHGDLDRGACLCSAFFGQAQQTWKSHLGRSLLCDTEGVTLPLPSSVLSSVNCG